MQVMWITSPAHNIHVVALYWFVTLFLVQEVCDIALNIIILVTDHGALESREGVDKPTRDPIITVLHQCTCDTSHTCCVDCWVQHILNAFGQLQSPPKTSRVHWVSQSLSLRLPMMLNLKHDSYFLFCSPLNLNLTSCEINLWNWVWHNANLAPSLANSRLGEMTTSAVSAK